MTSFDKPTTPEPAGPSSTPSEDQKAVTQAALFDAFGGIRGTVETMLPGLLFVMIYTINKDVKLSAIAAGAVAVLLVIVRLLRKDTVKHAFSGVFGVGVGVAFALFTGSAKGFYLPGMIYGVGLGAAFTISALVGFPLLGVMLGPVFKENLSWRTRNPGRKKAYTKASLAWGLIFLAKYAILFPLYWWGDATQLGWVLIALKLPPMVLAVYFTWLFLAKAPPPINVIEEWEAEERAEKAAKAARAAAKEPGL
ncbi:MULTISPECIES: DUF3159 domain-containing protein [Streptomyces]|uniref:DUF3159 domain-containing protein n=1 Tax=Streptomyces TaxID=1883 RepID=UPI0022707BCF|nr:MULTISPECIES: DUF3159 domain-containing protein [unclassified Streptomyces]MCY0946734.1 DUF3159 domain-containing protein [Streptomyces sp. H34-AA3]MCZ4085176.1 DUF3159 domain-containing protein [Streptomyces sp. H34-S5]